MESSSLFIAIVLSLAVLSSMMFNPRRLEAIGYSLSILFLQVLIAGHEDVFLICPQFPIYLSPLDTNLNPNNTMPDSRAKGVYVDTALLLARCTRVRNTTGSIADAFRTAYQDRHFDLFSKLDITGLEIPILEERKRGPTRHPKDLEEYVRSVVSALDDATTQVFTQAGLLFSSLRFLYQDLVILLATTGEYYRLAVLQRDHNALLDMPIGFLIEELTEAHDTPDLGYDIEDFCGRPVGCMTAAKDRQQLEKNRREQEIARQDNARKARADARAAREKALPKLEARARQRSQFILDAGPPPYPDGVIEKYHELSDFTRYQRYPAFFEPEPVPGESVESLAQLRDPKISRHVVFTGAIRVGSSVSDKFVGIIRDYLAKMAHAERARRD
jgi:hypothetical protein